MPELPSLDVATSAMPMASRPDSPTVGERENLAPPPVISKLVEASVLVPPPNEEDSVMSRDRSPARTFASSPWMMADVPLTVNVPLVPVLLAVFTPMASPAALPEFCSTLTETNASVP